MKIKLINERNESYSLIEQVLINRGVPLEDIKHLLNTSFEKDVLDFKLLNNIERAANKVLEHIELGSNILIQVDPDVDGYTSSSLLYNYLKTNYPECNLFYQVHDDKTHGLEITQEIKERKFALIIIPDAGSNEFEKHRILHEDYGIDIVVLDHHDCDKESEYAIVVNNQMSEKYTNKSLVGVGVTWQFCRCFDSISDRGVTKANDYLDLVAVGLIGDMADMRNFETHHLIKEGLQIAERGMKAAQDGHDLSDFGLQHNNYFLNNLFVKQSFSLKNKITPIGVSFYIAPFINAVMRAGDLEERQKLFKAFLFDESKKKILSNKRGHKDGEMEEVCFQVLRMVNNVKNRQKKITENAFAEFDKNITPDYLNKNSVIIINTKNEIGKSYNGLLGNKIAPHYKRPTLVLAEQENGTYAGSGRNPESPECPDFKQFILDSGLAEYAEGHGNAFGVAFSKENLQNFVDYSNEHLNYKDFEEVYNVDFVFDSPSEINLNELMSLIDMDRDWGRQMEEPLIAFRNVKIKYENSIMMARHTLKIKGEKLQFLKFGYSDDSFALFPKSSDSIVFADIVGRLSLNCYNGTETVQVLASDIELAERLMYF